MKIGMFVIMCFMLMIILMVYNGTFSADENNQVQLYNVSTNYSEPYHSETDLSTTNVTSSYSLWTIATNPTLWYEAGFITWIIGFLGVGTAIMIAGVIFRNDILLLLPLFTLFILAIGMPLIMLYNFVHGSVTGMLSESICAPVGSQCLPAILAAALSITPIVLLGIFAAIEWWTQRQTT